jgi:hypothetical protein
VRAQDKWMDSDSMERGTPNVAFWEHDIRGAAGTDAESDTRAQELLDHESVSTTRKSYRRNLQTKVAPLS